MAEILSVSRQTISKWESGLGYPETEKLLFIAKELNVSLDYLFKEHLVKELGDIAWYLAEAATALEIPLEDILRTNIDKLKQRYPEGFEVKRSQIRLKGEL